MTRRSTALAVSLTVPLVMLVAACGSDGDDTDTSAVVTDVPSPATVADTIADTAVDEGLTGSITVMAPGPLTTALEAAAAAFEAANPGVSVSLNLGHVPALLAQLDEGVPGDVLVTPDETTMGQAETKGLTAGEPTPVVRNELTLVVPAGNPGGVSGLDALGDADLSIAACAAELPCGVLAVQLAETAGVTLAADSLDPGGSPAIVTKAATGEIDLGVVFAADVTAGGSKVEAVPVAAVAAVSSTVMATALADAPNPSVAEAFVAFLASPEGQALFVDAGFVAL
jgi:molybdate transport system substrate-binding protein